MCIVVAFERRATDKMVVCFPWDIYTYSFPTMFSSTWSFSCYLPVKEYVDLLFCLMLIISFTSKLIMVTSILREVPEELYVQIVLEPLSGLLQTTYKQGIRETSIISE